MLHSGDADINKIIREIIELDSRAVRIKKNVTARADAIIDETKETIKRMEKSELENAHLIAKENYRAQIQQAQNERETIISEMKDEIKKTYSRYNTEKDNKAQEVIEKLFDK